MLRLLCVIGLVCCVLVCTGSDLRAEGRPIGAFTTAPIRDPIDLGNLMLSDPVVASRFANHFGVEPGELAAYFYNNLKVGMLDRPTVVTAYYFAGNKVVSRTKTLPAGATVFVDFKGRPVIDQACGNPLTRVLPMPPGQSAPPVSSTIGPETELVEATMPYQPTVAQGGGLIAPLPLASVSPFTQILPTLIAPLLLGATATTGSKVVPEPSVLVVQAMGLMSVVAMASRSRRGRRRE